MLCDHWTCIDTDASATHLKRVRSRLQGNVATGLMDAEGNLLPPNKSIRVALEDGQEVFALLQVQLALRAKLPHFLLLIVCAVVRPRRNDCLPSPAWQADEEDKGGQGGKGTSMFLMSQGAAPNKCIINGPSVTYAKELEELYFYLTARDTYGNLARNGGEMFNVKISGPEGYQPKELEAKEQELKAKGLLDVPPKIEDRKDGARPPARRLAATGSSCRSLPPGRFLKPLAAPFRRLSLTSRLTLASPRMPLLLLAGSYIVSHSMRLKGKYEVSVELDGEPIAGSPFSTVAVSAAG